jgi:outer membrane protein TolC
MFVRILLALACACHWAAFSQETNAPAETRAMALRDCIDLALSHNLDLKIQYLSLDIARYNLGGAYGAYIPQFAFNARHDYISQPFEVDPKKAGVDYPYKMNTDTIGPSILGVLPMGLNYDFGFEARERDAVTDFSLNPNLISTYPPDGIRDTNTFYADARVVVRQHLLRNFWTDSNRHLITVRKKELRMSQEALRFQVMRTVLAVELAYYDLFAAREGVRAREKALELNQRLLAETRRRVEVGDLPPLEAEQAETQVQNTLTALASAREAFQLRQNALKTLFTDDLDKWAEIGVAPADTLLAIQEQANRTESFQKAMRNRPDLAEARLAVERSAATVRFQYNQLFPTLDFVGRYGGLGIRQDMGGASSDALHFRNKEYYYGVVLSFPLSNVAERNNYRAGKAAREIAELQLKRAEQEIMLQVTDYVSQVASRYSRVNSARKARTFAESALGAEEKKLQNGLTTTFVVLQLQETLTQARTAEAQALADYNRSLSQLAFAEGSTLERRGLTVEAR